MNIGGKCGAWHVSQHPYRPFTTSRRGFTLTRTTTAWHRRFLVLRRGLQVDNSCADLLANRLRSWPWQAVPCPPAARASVPETTDLRTDDDRKVVALQWGHRKTHRPIGQAIAFFVLEQDTLEVRF